MKKKALYSILSVALVPGLLYGQYGTRSQNATAYNHGRHLACRSPSFGLDDHIVYHSSQDGIHHEGYHWRTFVDVPQLIPDLLYPNNQAFPAVAVDSENLAVAIPYIAGDGLSRTEPHPMGQPLRVGVFFPAYAGTPYEWDFETIDPTIEPDITPYGGPPSITYSFHWENEAGDKKHVFFISFVGYESPENISSNQTVQIWVLMVNYPHADPPSILSCERLTVPWDGESWGSGYNCRRSSIASIAYGQEGVPPEEQVDSVFLHTVWKYDPGGVPNFYIAYAVTFINDPDPGEEWDIEEVGHPPASHPWQLLEDGTYGYNYNPEVSIYGERLFLSWENRRENQIYREIMRRYRYEYSFHYANYRRDWYPSYISPPPQGEPPQNMSTYGDWHSANDPSEFPQTYATSVIWQERPNDEYYEWRKRWHAHDPEGEYPNLHVLRDYGPDGYNDFYPHQVAEYSFVGGSRITGWFHFTWTQDATEPPPAYEVWYACIWEWPPYMFSSAQNRGHQDRIYIDPVVPVYYRIRCGDSTSSPYCIKRDGYSTIDGHKLDIGGKELVYNLPLLNPPGHYLVRAVVSAPRFFPDSSNSICETFDFDGEKIYVSVSPPNPETLDFIIPQELYKDGRVKLSISGERGAWLEDIKVYAFGVMESTQVQSPKGVVSSHPVNPPINLTVTPNIFNSAINIRYQIAEKEKVNLEVYDATGRLVKTLLRTRNLKPGTYSAVWNGRDEKGNLLPAGIYFVKLKTENYLLTRKVILMR